MRLELPPSLGGFGLPRLFLSFAFAASRFPLWLFLQLNRDLNNHQVKFDVYSFQFIHI